MVYNWINYIQPKLYPPTCLLCGTQGDGDMDICAICRNELPYIKSYCSICALPLPPEQGKKLICGSCLKKTPTFDKCYIPFTYDDPLSFLIGELKFSGKLQHARLLSQLFIRWILEKDMEQPDLIIPVPLHRSRLQERGFNQALELAGPIAHQLKIPIARNICRRVRATPTQTSLKRTERHKNVRDCFSVSNVLRCEHLVLLDDVVTTGSTVKELARLLKKHGAKRVDVWAIARTA